MIGDQKRLRIWSGERVGVCAKCGKEMMKQRMTALYVKESPYVNPMILCHVCGDCLPGLLNHLGVGMPERE